ncbi:MFS transporter [Nitratireductor pacificus]|uniref:Major facilitator superfamily protein n=1 Tax=Nitratireductor pacificus pht-3B TaxID=391937 RepID=K2M6D7_9HYPH|nr:MFS transporter [Nitratireductor pacificus]EKF17696.1 major facilitator superfamily protein [Nitratireductor pacificus pht-3B]
MQSSLLTVLSLSAGLTAACSYYNQSMLGNISDDFGLSASIVVLVPALTQLGNALGVLLIAPMGDSVDRKKLLILTISCLVLALTMAAVAPSFHWLAAASFLIGLTASVPQQLVPLSVHLASPQARGRVTGIMLSGILIGLLFSRAISGFVADHWNWRAMFLLAAISIAAVTALLARRLPRTAPAGQITYAELIGSLRSLIVAHPCLLRISCAQALLFSALLGFWSTLPLTVQDGPDGLSSAGIGAIGLAGIGGVIAASYAGRCADRYGAGRIASSGLFIVLSSFVFLAYSGTAVWSMVIGLFLMDAGVQASHAANQSRVCALDPAARNRLNTVFMASVLIGGSLGAILGGMVFAWLGWLGVCGLGMAAISLSYLLLPGSVPLAGERQLTVPAKAGTGV